MPLPETINTAYAASDPVLAADLVALQECIAGDLHPTRAVVLAAAKWQPKTSGRGAGGTTGLLQDGQWVWSGAGTSRLVCSVEIPEGHELVRVRWYYNRGGAGTMTRAIWTRDFATGAADVALSGPTNIATGAAWTSVDDSPAYIVAAATSIELEVTLSNAAHVFGGARFEYRKLA